jgi:hypothetical protein
MSNIARMILTLNGYIAAPASCPVTAWGHMHMHSFHAHERSNHSRKLRFQTTSKPQQV